MLRAERAEFFFWFVPPVVTFFGYMGTLVANEVKFFQMNLFGGGQDGSLGGISPVPLLGYVTAVNASES